MGDPTRDIMAPDNIVLRLLWVHNPLHHSKVVVQGGVAALSHTYLHTIILFVFAFA